MESLPLSEWNYENSLLAIYIQETKKFKLLTRKEEQELAARIEAGDKKATDELIKGNLRFVVFIAKRYAFNHTQLLDFISEGNKGLIAAVRKFDVSYGCKLITLATWDINQMIQRSRRLSMIVTIPKNKLDKKKLLEKNIRKFEQANSRTPSIPEIAKLVNLPEKSTSEYLECHGRIVWLDAQHLENDYHNTIPDTSDNAEERMVKRSKYSNVLRGIESLPQREALIIKYYYGIDCAEKLTTGEIAAVLGYSKERIRQLKAKAEKTLKERFRKHMGHLKVDY
jgi:RNA polymerase primary sigma factor